MRRLLFPLLLVICLNFLPVRADDSSALINEALDKVVTIEVNGYLPQVMKKITDQTSVPIEVPQHVYDLLPWGEQTNIKATIKNQTLRQTLTAITRKLGLSWELGPQSVKVTARAPLDRLGRRATLQELETMDALDSMQLDQSPPAGKPITVQWLIDAIDKKLAGEKSPVNLEFRPGDKVRADQVINLPRNSNLNDALKELSKQTDLTWYPWGQHVVVVTKEDQISRQLDRTITQHFNGADITQVLAELSQAAGVEFDFEAGALQRVPADFRRVTLVLDDARVREALEDIRGVTGLDYTIKPTAIYFSNQNAVAAPAATLPPIIANLQLGNGMQVFLRAGELPPDVQEYIDHKKAEAFQLMRKAMKDENFVPTTQPSPK